MVLRRRRRRSIGHQRSGSCRAGYRRRRCFLFYLLSTRDRLRPVRDVPVRRVRAAAHAVASHGYLRRRIQRAPHPAPSVRAHHHQ